MPKLKRTAYNSKSPRPNIEEYPYPRNTIGYGYDFVLNKNGNYAEINMKPHKGILTVGYNQHRDDANEDPNATPQYFIPIRPNGKYSWKRARRLDEIGFEVDKELASKKYDDMVTEIIKRRFRTCQFLSQYYIGELPDEMKNILRLKTKATPNARKGEKKYDTFDPDSDE